MRKNVFMYFLATISLLAVTLESCRKETIYVFDKGELKGLILERFGNNSSGIEDAKIIVEGSSPLISAMSGKDGRFDIQEIPAGTYNLVISKDSFSSYRYNGFVFYGGGTPYQLYVLLSKLPYFQITEVRVDTASDLYYDYYTTKLSFVITGKNKSGYVRYFISDKPEVSWQNYQVSDLIYVYLQNYSTSLTAKQTQRYKGGTKLYIKIYPALGNNGQEYPDTSTGLTVFPVNTTLGSETTTFVIPNISSNQ